MVARRHALSAAVGFVTVMLLAFTVWCVQLMLDVSELRESVSTRVHWLQSVHEVQVALTHGDVPPGQRATAHQTLSTLAAEVAADSRASQALVDNVQSAADAAGNAELSAAAAGTRAAELVPAIRGETAAISIELGQRWDAINLVAAISIFLAATTLSLLVYVRFVLLRRAQKTMTSLQSHLRDADRLAAVGTLAAGIAHEINNPMAYVIGNLEQLRERLLDGGSEGLDELRVLDEALQGAERATRIVRDLKMAAQPSAEEEACSDIEEVIEATLSIAGVELRGPIKVAKDFGGPPRIRGSKSRLGQVVLNLVINAAHAVRGGGEIKLITRHRPGGRVIVEIRDTGPGIPAAIAEHLFEPFVTSKPLGEGTGLGLFVCHNIVTALGGKIEVLTSAKGTTVRLELEPSGVEPPRPQPQTVVPSGKKRPRVLVVDDEELLAVVLARALASCEVRECSDAETALEILDAEEFDVVLCDVMMPGADGTDLYEAAVRRQPELGSRFVFMTGGVRDEQLRRAIEASGRPCLQKPFSTDAVREAIAATSRGSSTAAANEAEQEQHPEPR